MVALIWLRGLLARNARLAATALGVAVAVALLASIGIFLASSKAAMTQRAAANVAVDWQVEVQPGADPATVHAALVATPGVTRTLPVGFATTTGLTATTATGGGAATSTQTTGAGVVLGLPTRYRPTFPGTIRTLGTGRGGVLVAQQTAANLHVAPGDTIVIGRAGLSPAPVVVGAIVDLPQADSLFQHVGAPPNTQPAAPPDNVVLMPDHQWHDLFDPLAATRPDQVRTQFHTKLSHALPGDPAAASSRVTGYARNLEVRAAGAALVGDNLGATLAAARSDSLYAQVLFLFLGVPGAILAGLLTAAVAASGTRRRRREQALLRARGATTHQLVRLSVLEALLVGGIGAVVGLAAALLIGKTAFHSATFGATTAAAVVWCTTAAVIGLLIAVCAIAAPAWRDARSTTVAAARATVGRAPSPLWARGGVDLLLLGGSAVVFWLTSRNGYQLVLAPEGTPSISVSYWALAGPAMLWIGGGLLAWRIGALGLQRAHRAVAGALRPVTGDLSGPVAAGMSRQRRLLAGSLALVALAIAFASSTAVFNSTYKAQAEVDARLTNGADVRVTEPPGSTVGPGAARSIARLAGAQNVEPLQHRYAYVGADLQDLFGVRPGTIVDATKLQDAYFQGGSARQLMGRLRAQPNAILVSAETVKDFQLRPGDHLNLRVRDARTKQAQTVPFRYEGIVKEFPTAPRDSFLVANADYIARRTGTDAVSSFLVDTNGASPARVVTQLRGALPPTATVTDITTARRIVGSSLTAVDLSGLTRVELGFAVVLAAAAAGLVLALGLVERRRNFDIAAALGATPRQLSHFVWPEALYVTGGGLLLGTVLAWLLARMLVKVLTGVFDPPPDALSIPWAYLVLVGAVTVAAVALVTTFVIRRSTHPAPEALRDL